MNKPATNKASKLIESAPLGASLIVLSSIFYASYGIWTTLMGNFFGGYTASTLRSILVLLFLVPLALFAKQLGSLDIRRNWRYLVGMLFASLFVWGPLYYAILHVGIGLALSVLYASIVISLFFFGRLLAGERLTKDKLIAAILGFLGIAMIFGPNPAHATWLALGAVILCGFSSGLHGVISKKLPYNVTQTTIVGWTISVIANGIMMFVVSEKLPKIGLHIEWFYLVLFAIASIISSWAFVKGIKLIEAGAAGILGLLEIVFGIVFGVMFFNEHPSGIALSGVAIIIVASAIPYIKDYNQQRGAFDS